MLLILFIIIGDCDCIVHDSKLVIIIQYASGFQVIYVVLNGLTIPRGFGRLGYYVMVRLYSFLLLCQHSDI